MAKVDRMEQVGMDVTKIKSKIYSHFIDIHELQIRAVHAYNDNINMGAENARQVSISETTVQGL